MPSKAILAFDTSGSACDVAVLNQGQIIAKRFEPMSKGQAERLIPLVKETLQSAGQNINDIAAIGVGTGPGNFTGIRISVAAARGLAVALNIPTIGVTSFDALAFGAGRPVRALCPAPRGTWLCQFFVNGEPGTPETLQPGDARLEDSINIKRHASFALAPAIGRIALQRVNQENARPVPFYVRAANAAPQPDRGPVVLP